MDLLYAEESRELLKQILIELRQLNGLIAETNQIDEVKHKQFYNIESAATIVETTVDSLVSYKT